jgi:hypothetical protein
VDRVVSRTLSLCLLLLLLLLYHLIRLLLFEPLNFLEIRSDLGQVWVLRPRLGRWERSINKYDLGFLTSRGRRLWCRRCLLVELLG